MLANITKSSVCALSKNSEASGTSLLSLLPYISFKNEKHTKKSGSSVCAYCIDDRF